MSVRRLGRFAHPPNYCLHSFVWCVWVRTARPCISCLPWLCFCLVGLGLVISCCLPPEAAVFFPFFVAVPWFWRCCCLLSCLFWRLGCLRCDLLFPVFPFSPLGCPLVLSGPVSLAGPSLRISCCICDGPVVIPLTWRVVAIGSCLPSASWQQRLRPCVRLCPLHHAVGVVHVPLAAALRYSPSGDPESLWTPLKPHAPTLACVAYSFLPLLPSPGVRSSCLRVSACLLPPAPRCVWSCLPASSFVLVGVFAPSFVVVVWVVGVACSFLFAWESLSGFPVCWWFRSVWCLFLRLAFVGFAWRFVWQSVKY